MMRRIFTIVAALMMTVSAWAQSPEKMSYQSVIRDASDALVTSTVVGMQISILQGSITGTSVYTETQTPSSNINGLVSLEIGSGITIDNFSTIDWSNGPYFIKTEIDPTGGTTYTITATNQLMSVPYALHAKTAENITGTVNYTETDPSFAAWDKSTGITITESQISDLSHTFNTDTQLDETAVDAFVANNGYLTSETDPSVPTATQAGEMQYWNGTAWVVIPTTVNEGATLQMISGVPTWTGGTPPPPSISIGDFIYGGIVFWIDPNDDTKGLVCSIENQSTGIQWFNGWPATTTGATGSAIGTGQANTNTIIASLGATETDYAAGLAKAYAGGSYNDWYLPSKDELNEMYLNRAAINVTATSNAGTAFNNVYYWSSTEGSIDLAWRKDFTNGANANGGKSGIHYVRAIRKF
jgi:hypothetical protein